MMIDDLSNDMLREILCRLPCYRTALGCKTVSKWWCSLISDPLFVTQGFLTKRQVIEKEASFIFLLTSKNWDNKYATVMVAPPCFQRTTLWSPILSLQFLPFHSKPVATFKDLILSFGVNPLTGLGMFYICNPLTKQWMVLPPSQEVHQKEVIWAALAYLDGHGGFRVVVAHSQPYPSYFTDPFRMVNLLIYISETSEWRNIDVKLQVKPSNDGYYVLDTNCKTFKGVVCKGMVYILLGPHFGVLNPFDVTDTFSGTLMAKPLPTPNQDNVYTFLESGGKLVACQNDTCISVGKTYNYFSHPWRNWKFDVRLENDEQVVVEWKLISKFYIFSRVKGYISNDSSKSSVDDYIVKVVGVHPTNETLIYFISDQNQLILFDTKSEALEVLTTTLLPHAIWNSYKLDIPSWPTPIPIGP
ncbi:uncharacterized protein LOC141636932 [Silene latifolia]|uniref:uncharacterized protein LOC141636932 n=1 Tax=Silene latifolia TaxID=37657 RepID=UPI003D77CEB7